MRLRTLAVLAALLPFCPPTKAEADPPKPAAVWLGDVEQYTPVSSVTHPPFTLTLPASMRSRFETVSKFPIEINAPNHAPGVLNGNRIEQDFEWLPEARIGARLESSFDDFPVHLVAEYEHDLTTGTAVGAPDEAGDGLPNGEQLHAQLRKGYLRADIGKYLVIGGGYMLSHWGLGLLANDGAHGWTPGSARFSDPRSGDRVLRGYIGTQPLGPLGFFMRFAYDDVVDDDPLLKHDDATQYILSARVGSEQTTTGGIYIVYRQQNSTVGRGFDALVFDAMASTNITLDDFGVLTLAAEGAVITGDTRLGPTVDISEHDLLQYAFTADARLDLGGYGGVLSFLLASGDQNFDDDEQNAFKVDPNYEFGLLLFRQVMAAQTGRAPITASDPTLVGRPVPDLERIPTRGSPSNTIAVFPRGWLRSQDGLEVYGGPLIAFSEVNYSDPLNSRLHGGEPHNALGRNPSGFYGVELDAGIRYRAMFNGTELTLGWEGGVLFPGNAFSEDGGARMGDVLGTRLMIDYRL